MAKLLAKPDTRCAGMTMLGKVVEVSGHQVGAGGCDLSRGELEGVG
jgi:hypothetical protein